jgi:hypothetical protein
MATTPIVTVDEPPDSRRSSILLDDFSCLKKPEAVDITEGDLEDFGPGSSSSAPLRVVYSPTVSRRPTIGSSSHSPRPSLGLDRVSSDSKTEVEKLPSPTTSVSLEVALGQENRAFRRRNSTVATANTGYQHLTTHARVPSPRVSSHRSRSNSGSSPSLEANRPELPLAPTHFVALRNRRWLRSTIIAKICLVIVSFCVIGNIIYT